MSVTNTTTSFSTMLNEYLPDSVLMEEVVKRDYILSNVEKDNNWLGGDYIVPFKAAGASSIKLGGLSSANDIAEDSYIRGKVSDYKEAWGSMIFNHADLMQHGALSEQNLLKILPDAVDQFSDNMRNTISRALLVGAAYAKFTVDGDNTGVVTIDRPDCLIIGQKVLVYDDNTSASTGYVKTIDMNLLTALIVTARGGATPVDCSNFTVAQNARLLMDGGDTADNQYQSLRDAFLSAANGGGATLHGQTKTSYPYLQAINIQGNDVTASNILEKIFDGLVKVRQFGRGRPTEVVMSYKNLGNCMKVIEGSKGAYNVQPGSQKANPYGWEEIVIGTVAKGSLKLVGVQEASDTEIIFLDWRSIAFASNGFIQKRKAPDGKEYFEVRNTTGYQYILDICLFGELIVKRPSYSGIMYGISY